MRRFPPAICNKNRTATLHDLIRQSSQLKDVKRMGTTSAYKRPSAKEQHELIVILFADAGRPSTHGHQGFIGGLLIGKLKARSIVHSISWSSHLCTRPVKSIASAVILAAGCAIDEDKIISDSYTKLLGVGAHLHVFVDSKDLFNSLSTCRVPEEKSIVSFCNPKIVNL